MRKSKVSASQNSPKTLPKTLPNGGSKKHMIFERIFDNIFQNSKPRNLENINFASTGARFLRFSLKSCFCYFRAFSDKKSYPKPFQNEVQTLEKSMPKTCCFSASIFEAFGLDFGASWTSKMEPSWLQKRIFIMGTSILGRSKCLLKLDVF